MNNVLRCLLLSALAVAMTGALGLIMFAAAGRWDLPMMWTWVGIVGAVMLAGFVMIDPGLLKERIRPGPGGRDGRVLIALKLLARHVDRPQDDADVRALLRVADEQDLAIARDAVGLIEQRGFARGRDLHAALAELVAP